MKLRCGRLPPEFDFRVRDVLDFEPPDRENPHSTLLQGEHTNEQRRIKAEQRSAEQSAIE
jgi:hypothetical protein